MGPLIFLTCLMLAAVFLTLFFLSMDHYLAGVFKMTASTCFVVLSIAYGAVHSNYGLLILLGLIFSWWGDLFLISHSSLIFILGLFSFLFAHIAYCAAFITYGVELSHALYAFIGVMIPGLFILHWLYPYLGKMRLPVLLYILFITIMVALASAATLSTGNLLIVIGAFLFLCSDIFVARDRFVTEEKINHLLGLPLYYSAQLFLATSVMYAW